MCIIRNFFDCIMKVIAFIPARMESTRLPGKLMKELGGKPVIVRTYESIKNIKLIDRVVVDIYYYNKT